MAVGAFGLERLSCIALPKLPKLSFRIQLVKLPAVSVSHIRLCSPLLTARLRFAAQETKMNSDVLTPINDWLRTWRSFR